MAFADANRASIRVIEETTWGVTPTAGETREVRLTSSALEAAKETATSDEIRADRMVSAITETAASSQGDINFEFSAGAQDEFLAAFVMGAWSRPMSRDMWAGANIAVTAATDITVSGLDLTGYLEAGKRIAVKGFTNDENNGYFQIATVTLNADSTVIVVDATDLVVEAGTAKVKLYDANDVVVLNDTTISSVADGFESTGTAFASGAATEQFVPGQKIVVDGLTGVTGIYTIKSVTDSKITTVEAPTAVVAEGEVVNVKASMLRNPSDFEDIAQRSFTIETAFNDVSQYMVQDGMVPGTFSLEIAAGSIVTGTVGWQGRATKMVSASVLNDVGSYDVLEATTGEVVNATTNVGQISKNGVESGVAIQSISLSGEANLRQRAAVGSKFSRGIGAGRFNLTGSLSMYFENDEMFTDFIDHKTLSLSFPITDLDGQTYVLTVPAIKVTADQVAPGGIDQDVVDNVEFEAFRDPATGCMLQIDRFSPNFVA